MEKRQTNKTKREKRYKDSTKRWWERERRTNRKILRKGVKKEIIFWGQIDWLKEETRDTKWNAQRNTEVKTENWKKGHAC